MEYQETIYLKKWCTDLRIKLSIEETQMTEKDF